MILPQAAAGWYAYTAYDTVTEVFEESEPTDVLVPVADEFDVPAATATIRTGPGGLAAADPTSIAGGDADTRAGGGRAGRAEGGGEAPPRLAEARAGSTSCCSAPTRAPAAPACAPTR